MNLCTEGNKTCKARKVHHCDVCGEKIAVGELQVTRSGVGGDGWWRMHLHPECEEYSDDWDEMDWESSFPGGNVSRKEAIQAHKTENKCKRTYVRSTGPQTHVYRCPICGDEEEVGP